MERMHCYVSNKNSLIVPTYFAYFCNFPWGTVRVQNVHFDHQCPIAMISASKLHFEKKLALAYYRVSFKVHPQKCAVQKVIWDFQTFMTSLGLVDVQDNTSRLLSRNMKAARPRSQIGSNNIIRNQQSLFSFLLSGLEHVLYNQTKENNIVSTIKLCDPATIRSKSSSYWHFWHKSAITDGTINTSWPSISLACKSEKNRPWLQFQKNKTIIIFLVWNNIW